MSDIAVLFPNKEMEKSKSIKTTEIPLVTLKVIGVGGGGVNAVNSMIDAKIENVDFYAINTDSAMLRRSKCDNKIQIGNDGFGAGGDPQKGRKCAEESIDELKDMLSGADMVFITTGMGGGTGTGAAPLVAKLSKELGILTVAVVTKPFTSEGQTRIDNAEKGIKEIKQYADALVIIPNDRVYMIDKKTSLDDAFKVIDNVLRMAIEAIVDTIVKTGKHINIDFSDVKKVLTNTEYAIIGIGDGKSCKEALDIALENVFVEGPNIKEATNVLINVSCSDNNPYTLEDSKLLDETLKKEFKNLTMSKVGDIDSESLDTRVKISIIASSTKQATIQDDLFINNQEEKVIKQEEYEQQDFTKQTLKKKVNILNVNQEKDSNAFSRPAYEFWTLKHLK